MCVCLSLSLDLYTYICMSGCLILEPVCVLTQRVHCCLLFCVCVCVLSFSVHIQCHVGCSYPSMCSCVSVFDFLSLCVYTYVTQSTAQRRATMQEEPQQVELLLLVSSHVAVVVVS